MSKRTISKVLAFLALILVVAVFLVSVGIPRGNNGGDAGSVGSADAPPTDVMSAAGTQELQSHDAASSADPGGGSAGGVGGGQGSMNGGGSAGSSGGTGDGAGGADVAGDPGSGAGGTGSMGGSGSGVGAGYVAGGDGDSDAETGSDSAGDDVEGMQPEPLGIPTFEPYAVEETHPDKMIASTGIMADGAIVESFSFPEPIDFSYGSEYTELEGIITFRGNNLRDTAAYGRAEITEGKFGDKWSYRTGSYTASDGVTWSGNGWTGQPLIVKWPAETRAMMNMYEWAAAQDELVEVIYATMDGYVYFTELETGEATRDRLYLGFPFKGSGALDPRGYPLLYVGAGYGGAMGSTRILVVSLVDGSVLYTFGFNDSFAQRNWNAADGSALVDAATDNLIYPSENGVLYIIKLNSEFDPEAGIMTIAPSSPVKWRFKGKRSQVNGMYWLGIESSPAIWRGHIFLTDNGGHLICLDINSLELVWAQDVLDDTNCTPVLELEDGHPYIYISTSYHLGWRAQSGTAAVPLWKIDAVTGEIVWRTDYDCYSISGVSGGVQGTAAVGKNSLQELVYFPVAMTVTRYGGILVALDKQTGEVVWEYKTNDYAWSSPVCVYDEDGNGCIIYCTSGGNMHLLNGLTGEKLDSILLGGVIEASPAVYDSIVVVGTRDMRTWGVRLT